MHHCLSPYAPQGGVAAPAGRSRFGGAWGCTMAISMAAGPAQAELSVPSGQVIELYEVVEDGETVRFRFLAPEIARDTGDFSYADVVEDFASLCAKVALPWLSERTFEPKQVVISMSDRKTDFGVADPGATQFFEAFSVMDGACIWEVF